MGASPNLLLIIADDQAYRDFGFMGSAEVETPHLDELASRSARFVNGYVPTSVCSPSLATLLTGLYPHESGLHYNHPPPGNAGFNAMGSREEYERVRGESYDLIRSADTLPRVLGERLGYVSLQTGKFWEGHFRNAGFTEGMTLMEPVPGQAFGGNRVLANGELAAHGNGDWGLKIGRETMEPIFEFVEAKDARGESWLVWYAPYLPHEPHDAPERWRERYVGKPGVESHEVPYFASCSQFDDTVGQLLGFLEGRGLMEDTVVVFVIDNGWAPSRERGKKGGYGHTRRSKRSPFEDGLRTPILIRWDGVVKPGTHEGLVSSVDIVPTLYSAAGIGGEDRGGLPGMDLMPYARGEVELPEGRAVFGEIYPGDASVLGEPSRDVAYRWVRQGRDKLIVPHADAGGDVWGGYLEGDALFDVVDDPGEERNLIGEEALGERVMALRKMLDDWWTPGVKE
ncbi:MAG: sulfatase-like hydrolase/transferase [Verrucomicrobiota bacterium]